MKTINWHNAKNNEKGYYKDDNGKVFYFNPASYLNFTSDNDQDSYDFWMTNTGTLVRDKNDYFVFSEIGIKDALRDAAEHETDISNLAKKMKEYADEVLHD
jgi:hypothetical protein